MSYSSEVTSRSPLGYWKFDEAGVVPATDSSGTANWTYASGVTGSLTALTADGGKSVHGSGTAPIATFGSVPAGLSGANVTLEAWISIPSGNTKGSIVKVGSGSNGWGMGLGNTQWDNVGRKLILLSEAVAWHPTSYTFPAGAGTYHVMVVRGASGAVTAYVNGTSVWSGTLTSPITATTQMGVGGYTETYGFKLDSAINVDNVALFASALSSARVTAHYNSGSGDNAAVLADSPVAFLKFDEALPFGYDGLSAADSSGNARHLTHIGSPTEGLTSLLGDGTGKSIGYNGSSQASTRASASWMDATVASAVVRINVDSAALTGQQFVASRWQGGNPNNAWLWSINAGKPEITIYAASANRTVTAPSNISTGQHTLGWSYNGTTLKLYVDGSSVGSLSVTGSLPTGLGAPLEVARAALAAYGAVKLDEFAFFGTALSDADHLAIHDAAVSVGDNRTGAVAATLPGLSAAVAGTYTPAAITGVAAATLPGLSAAVDGTHVSNDRTGVVGATLPALSASVAGTHVSNDVAGDVAATLPGLGASVAGTALPPAVTGDLTATLTGLSAAVVGDLADPPVTGDLSATLPSLSASVTGVIPVQGAVAATLPALISAVADAGGNVAAVVHASLPGLSAGVVGTQPTVRGLPSTSNPTVLPFVTSGYATATPPLAVVPEGYTERPIMRASRVVPDLRTIEGVIVDPVTNQPRLTDDLYFALPVTEAEVGVPHLIFHHHGKVVDATYFRGGFTKILTDRREEPFGDATMSFELPNVSSMDSYPDDEDHPLWFLINRANVQIELVKSDGSSTIVWTGHVVATDTGNSESSPNKRLDCVGSLFQASTDRMHPPPFLDPTDVGTLMSRALTAVTSRRYPVISAVATGIMSRQRGSWADSPLAFVQSLLSTAWTSGGNQWTIAKIEGSRRSYEIRLKKTTPEWTVTNGAHGVSVDLTRDGSAIRNVIYGHGVGPDGNAWFNYKYPNLHSDTAPEYPFASPSSVITIGTTDGDTTSGDGVSVWQRRARDLGYKLAIDGVFNTSDAEVARYVQRRFGASVDGVVGPQTWNATFGVGSNSGDLSSVIRLPLAADPRTQRYLYNGDGSVAGENPEFDGNVLIYADDVDFGAGITRAEGIVSAQQIVDRESEPGLTGRIVLTQDPRENSRMLIPPGDKITLVGYEGADRVLHITAVERDWQTGTVTLDVDEKSRDAMTVAQIRTRDKEARRDPARRPGNPNRRSRLDVDQVVPFDGESGAGVIPKLALYGGLWTVIRIPVSETGRVAKMHLEAGSPFAIAFFGAPITPAHLVSYVGNPLASDAPFEPHERELDAHWFIEGFGQKGQRCGYYPGAEDRSTPFTGVEEQGGFEYTSSRAPWVWVAMFAASSCFLEGNIYPDTVV